MTTILFMVSVALILSFVFVCCYVWALSSGQFDDPETPAIRMLKEDFKINEKNERTQK